MKSGSKNIRGLGILPYGNLFRSVGRLNVKNFACVMTWAVLAMVVPNSVQQELYRIQYKSGYTEKIVIPNSLPEPNLLRTSFQEFGITFLSLAVFPMQKCFEYY